MYLLLFHDTKQPLHIFQLPTADLPFCTVDEPENTQKTTDQNEYIFDLEIQIPINFKRVYNKHN